MVGDLDALARYQQVEDGLCRAAGAQGGKMFGMPCLKIGGRAFAGLYQDHMVFKLRGGVLAEALALDGSRPFDPMGGRPMREWVQVPFSQADRWQALAEAALSLQREANG